VYPGRVLFFKPPVDLYLKLYGYSVFDRIGQPRSWAHYILPDWWAAIGAPGIVLLVGIGVSGAWLAHRARAADTRASVSGWLRRSRSVFRQWQGAPEEGVLVLVGSAILLAVIYGFTPATAQGTKSAPFPGLVGGNSRTLMPAVVLAGPAVAWTVSRLGRRAALVASVAALAATFDGLHETFQLPLGGLVNFTLEAGALVIILTILARWARRWSAPVKRGAVATASALLAVGVVAIGEHGQRHFNHYRYVGFDPAVDWVIVNAPTGHRVGVAGNWKTGLPPSPILPMFGPRFGNKVAFVGRMYVGTLIQYTDGRRFVAAVRRGRYDVLLVGREAPPLGGALSTPGWAREAGFRPVAASSRFIVFVSPSFRPRAYKARVSEARNAATTSS
jgi:hypothetical protein